MQLWSSAKAGCYGLRVCYVTMTMVILDYMCVQSFIITHMHCFMLIIKGYGNTCTHWQRLVAIGYEYVMLP